MQVHFEQSTASLEDQPSYLHSYLPRGASFRELLSAHFCCIDCDISEKSRDYVLSP